MCVLFYFCALSLAPVTLDPSTTNLTLTVSEDTSSVREGDMRQHQVVPSNGLECTNGMSENRQFPDLSKFHKNMITELCDHEHLYL